MREEPDDVRAGSVSSEPQEFAGGFAGLYGWLAPSFHPGFNASPVRASDMLRLPAQAAPRWTAMKRGDGRTVTYGFGELNMLVPAYAATIHKSQGSE
jgi:hypothetical protein